MFKDGRKSITDDSRTDQQREIRLSICKDLIETANNDSDFFKTIITGDETWCFLFDPQTKKQSLEWHTPSSPRKKKVHFDKSKGKKKTKVWHFFTMNLKKEQRVCIIFCQKLRKMASETFQMLKLAFREAALSQSKMFKWFARFKSGRESTQDDPR
ncbi:hypothetical protein LAZ67_9001952 [Cordylochernes scorpioides]|uniref:Mos1 transposase HTH domain-containing protein n=1 Tax=Cordylochernes scorpioides TaxID=51811 RepID=A0ABY6KV41_9ARAC|nr:hypothetical protein LAZ67_9001952 [Cordylochernes scorpioides]